MLLQAIVSKNIGCSYFLVEEHQASGSFSHWSAKGAFDLLEQFKEEIGITPIFTPKFFYLESQHKYLPEFQISHLQKHEIQYLSEKNIMNMLDNGLELPDWFLSPKGEDFLPSFE